MCGIDGEVIVCGQGVGGPIQLRIYGDEFYSRYETLDGYTVVYDTEKRCYCYASLAADRFVSSGVPTGKARPVGLKRHLKEGPSVRNEKFDRRYRRLRPRELDTGISTMRTLGPDDGLLTGRKLTSGTIRGLTLIVDFDDIQTSISTDAVDAMLNGDNYSANGNFCSVREYFELVSSGKLTYRNTVVGPIQLSKRRSHYINNLLVKEALDIAVADHGVDLTQFDSRDEGIVDAINFLYAGDSQYSGDLWPHNSFETLQYGSMRTHYYQLVGLGMTNVDLRIGTICHENGHLLCRFPDMYDYGKRDGDFEKSQGIGRYCLMGSGNHLNSRRTPAPICGYLRDLVGWIDTEIDLNIPGAHTAQHGEYSTVMKYRTDKTNEYFVIENRTQLGLDAHLPASGLAVLHCDTLGSNEWQDGTRNRHYQCALLQADGHLDLEHNRNPGDMGDLFADRSGVALSDTTVPSSREWDDTDSGLIVSDISAPGEAMTFTIGQSQEDLVVKEESFPNEIIPDKNSAGVTSTVDVSVAGVANSVAVGLRVIHSWISDLVVTIEGPDGTKATLHDRAGGDGDDIETTWTSDPGAAAPKVHLAALEAFAGKEIEGEWKLHIEDKASDDVGRLLEWSVEIGYEKSGGVIEETAEPDAVIPDDDPTGFTSTIPVAQEGVVKDVAVSVDIEHTWIGDLTIDLISPIGQVARLHANTGWDDHDIKRTYSRASTASLEDMVGQPTKGDWRLRVRDRAGDDEGTLKSWSLRLEH